MSLAKNFLIIFIALATLKSINALIGREDENFFGDNEADRYDWSTHPCRRECKAGDKRTCYYVFVVEQFSTMSKACYDCPFNITDCFRPHCITAGGAQKTIYTANRQIPGPLVEICEDDTVEVEVRNRLLAEGTTIHWHGFNQMGTPYMDGVPYVTQCPIMPGDNFKYIFNATTTGTFFWHSHIGVQRADGLFGALIVNKVKHHKVTQDMFDKDEHRIIINDWMTMPGMDNQMKMYYVAPTVTPDTILVNGLALFQNFTRDNITFFYTPVPVFDVEKDKKHRFRLIDAGAEDCPIEMTVDNHTMHVISLDSNDIEPVEVEAITIWPGERVDFTINCHREIDNYFIRFRGYGQCQSQTKNVSQIAVLHYEGAPVVYLKGPIRYDDAIFDGMRVFNPFNRGTESRSKTDVNVPDMVSIESNDDRYNETVDKQIYISFDFYNIDNYDFARKNLYDYRQIGLDPKYQNRWIGTLQFNHISMQMPPFPLLSQWQQIEPDMLCNDENPPGNKNCTAEYCLCPHVIAVGLDDLVEVFFIDEGGIVVNHPLHLHGHFFRVIAERRLNSTVSAETVRLMDENNEIERNLVNAPMKDTMKAPGNGFTIVRFRANNPGYWFFHCHFEQHSNIGMALIFKVGEHSDFPEKPANFPQCGNFALKESEKQINKMRNSPIAPEGNSIANPTSSEDNNSEY